MSRDKGRHKREIKNMCSMYVIQYKNVNVGETSNRCFINFIRNAHFR